MSKPKSKSKQPAFPDGSFFKDVPMFFYDEQSGSYVVPDEQESE